MSGTCLMQDPFALISWQFGLNWIFFFFIVIIYIEFDWIVLGDKNVINVINLMLGTL